MPCFGEEPGVKGKNKKACRADSGHQEKAGDQMRGHVKGADIDHDHAGVGKVYDKPVQAVVHAGLQDAFFPKQVAGEHNGKQHKELGIHNIKSSGNANETMGAGRRNI